MAEGVLGLQTLGGNITIVSGWDWYLGANTSAIGANQYDFQTVVTHEIGHALGLGHSADTSSVMYAWLGTGEARRDLTINDLALLGASTGEEDGAAEPLLAKSIPHHAPFHKLMPRPAQHDTAAVDQFYTQLGTKQTTAHSNVKTVNHNKNQKPKPASSQKATGKVNKNVAPKNQSKNH